MSTWWLGAAGLMAWSALAIAQPYRRWIPADQERFQAVSEFVAKVLVVGAIVLAFQIGRANP